MRHRMAVAVLALGGLLVSTYLLLYKFGVIGSMVCGAANECERVQASRYAEFLGFPVAAYGVAGYLVLLILALYGLQESQLSRPAATRWLAGLSALGVGFSLYLLYLELFVIHAICRWCSMSGVLILTICAVSIGGLAGSSRAPAP
ncbi:MAG: vitamin K epoxide reductase family protein [Gemmatimonadales bacterium]|jgi:uncharacterized membrane protein